jgi:adenine-specific DNA-methyltransferase
MQVPLVISYPSTGLLADVGTSVPDVARLHFRTVETQSFDASHSTMGASKGAPKKSATENLYVCTD